MSNEEIQNLLRTGIQTAQSGNKAIARRILEQVVAQDPQNELGWIWLASVVDAPSERRECLQKALAINPNNERAKQALDKLNQLREAGRPPTPRPAQAPSRLTPPLAPEPLAPARPISTPGIDRQALGRSSAAHQGHTPSSPPDVACMVCPGRVPGALDDRWGSVLAVG